MAVNFKDFETMSPERRAKELKTLIEMLKNEIEKTKTDLAQKEKDLKDAQEFLLKSEEETKLLESTFEKEKTRENKKDEIKIEEKKEEKETKTLKKEEDSLEEKLSGAPRLKASQEQSYFAKKTLADIDKITSYISEKQQKTGIETEQDRKLMYEASKELEYRQNKIEEGTYNADREARKHLEHAKETVKKEDKHYQKNVF